MTQEQKESLVKDLCARLPYRLKCSFGVDDAIYEITGINPSACGASEIQATHVKSGVNGDFKLNSCKPYLLPLSSMTEEQKKEFELLFDLNYASAYSQELQIAANMIKWLNKNHFDIYGLIPKGLAIDCTNLNIY